MKMPPPHTHTDDKPVRKSADICMGRVGNICVVEIGEETPAACKQGEMEKMFPGARCSSVAVNDLTFRAQTQDMKLMCFKTVIWERRSRQIDQHLMRKENSRGAKAGQTCY